MFRPRTCTVLVTVASCVVALTGCSKRLDTAGLETALRTDIQRKANVSIRSVSCPHDLQPRKGATFICALTYADGSTHHVRITQTDDYGDVRYAVTD